MIFRMLKNRIIINKLIGNSSSIIHPTTTFKQHEHICFKGNVFIGENSKLLCWDRYSYKGKKQQLYPYIEIGNNVHITRNLTIQCAGKIIIEDDVLIASDVFIINYNHGINPLEPNYLDNKLDSKEVIIHKGVWIGNNAIILPGVEIGEKSIIGAGSVVTKSIPDYCIAAGNPAIVIKKFDFEANKWVKINEHN